VVEVFSHPLHPHFYDFDLMGIAHNVAYIRWMEDARAAFLDASPWPMSRFWAFDYAPAITRTEIHYRKPIRPYDPVAIQIHVLKYGKTRWTLGLAFVNPEFETHYADGSQSGYFLRPSTGRPAPMPMEFVEFCRPYFTETEDTARE
jgi:acyl-CoA thioester hydrolase